MKLELTEKEWWLVRKLVHDAVEAIRSEKNSTAMNIPDQMDLMSMDRKFQSLAGKKKMGLVEFAEVVMKIRLTDTQKAILRDLGGWKAEDSVRHFPRQPGRTTLDKILSAYKKHESEGAK